jgi:hypothetical protein
MKSFLASSKSTPLGAHCHPKIFSNFAEILRKYWSIPRFVGRQLRIDIHLSITVLCFSRMIKLNADFWRCLLWEKSTRENAKLNIVSQWSRLRVHWQGKMLQ